MEEGKKKMIMIGVIVACIAAAVIITVATHSGSSIGGIESIKRGEAMFWIKCRNPKCEHTWQMDKRDYFDYLEKHRVAMTVPGIVCPKCGEGSGYLAEKCGKCEFVFERVATSDVPDRCPKCGYSAMEELRKKARGEVEQTTEKQ
jgi:ssDNA-binding Zn-finger/Zn-ribbon topoisomerase 1